MNQIIELIPVLELPDFQLSWSHYQVLLRIENREERAFYEIEAAQNNWSLRGAEILALDKESDGLILDILNLR